MKKWFGLFALAAMVATVVFVNLSANGKRPESSAQVGEAAPGFTLMDIEGKSHSLADYKGQVVVLEWINHGCPYVKKHYDTGNMQSVQEMAKSKGAVWLSVCSSAEGKQGYMKPADWVKANQEKKTNASTVLLDSSGDVGRSFGAKTTPHMFIVDENGILVYKGAIDDRPTADKADVEGAKNYVLAALDEKTAGKKISMAQTEAYGCSVKY